MNSLGAGGAESPYLINAANALVFALSMPFIMSMQNSLLTTQSAIPSGIPVCLWWSDCQSHWYELDIAVGCGWLSDIFVSHERLETLQSNEDLTEDIGLHCIRTIAT